MHILLDITHYYAILCNFLNNFTLHSVTDMSRSRLHLALWTSKVYECNQFSSSQIFGKSAIIDKSAIKASATTYCFFTHIQFQNFYKHIAALQKVVYAKAL